MELCGIAEASQPLVGPGPVPGCLERGQSSIPGRVVGAVFEICGYLRRCRPQPVDQTIPLRQTAAVAFEAKESIVRGDETLGIPILNRVGELAKHIVGTRLKRCLNDAVGEGL